MQFPPVPEQEAEAWECRQGNGKAEKEKAGWGGNPTGVSPSVWLPPPAACPRAACTLLSSLLTFLDGVALNGY